LGLIKQILFFCLQSLANRSLVDDILSKVEKLKPIAAELNVPMSQLAIAWCAKNPNVSSVITGATKEYQVTLTPIP
jgi:aryl-alcohol dehydrogenase-like predicted oxidoreductase